MILRDTVVEVDLRAIGANMDAICQWWARTLR